MSTHTRLSLLGVLCVMLVSAPFIVWGQTGDPPWETYNQAGRDAYEQGNYAEAEKQWVAALQEAEKFGPEDSRLATSLNSLANLYWDQGKYGEAEPLFKRALAIREKALGPEHSDVATTLKDLAILYLDQLRYGEAEPLFKRSLEITEKALGPEHLDVAFSLENYAYLLRRTGREEEAAKMEARAEAIRAKHAQENPQK